MKLRKNAGSKKREKSLEISVFSFLVAFAESDAINKDADFVLANLDAARWHTSPLVKQGLASDRYLPGRNAMPVNKSMYFYCEQNLQ